jgi:hypothetical protein
MRKALAIVAIAGIGAITAASPVAAPAQPVAHASCVNARTPGGVKCLGAGEFCSHKPGYAAAYRRAGFKCKANGHLAYR